MISDYTILYLTEELLETPTLDLNFLSGSASETIETLNAQLMLELNHESAKLETDELIQTLNGEMTNILNRELFRYNIFATLPKEEMTYPDLSVEDVLNECGVDMETMKSTSMIIHNIHV